MHNKGQGRHLTGFHKNLENNCSHENFTVDYNLLHCKNYPLPSGLLSREEKNISLTLYQTTKMQICSP